MFLFQTGVFASFDSSQSNFRRTQDVSRITSLDQPVQNYVQKSSKSLYSEIYKPGADATRNATFYYLNETDQYQRAKLWNELKSMLSKDALIEAEKLRVDSEFQKIDRPIFSYHVRTMKLDEFLAAGNDTQLKRGLSELRSEALVLGLSENSPLKDAISGAAIRNNESEDVSIQKYGQKLIDLAKAAGYSMKSLLDTAKSWNVHAPLGSITPTRNIVSRMLSDAQKLLQQTANSMSENLDKYNEAKEAVQREREYGDSKVGNLVNGMVKENPANESATLEQYYAYHMRTAEANSLTTPELITHLNTNEEDFKLFTDPNFFLKNPPIFVHSLVA